MDKGYDPALVPDKLCLLCSQRIGKHAWREVKTPARFGQMLFEHVECPPVTVFICPVTKCAYAIASDSLNELQLKMLRRTAKKCPGCDTLQRFTEQTILPNIQTKTTKSYGGTQHEDLTIKTNSTVPKTASQRRRSNRYAGH